MDTFQAQVSTTACLVCFFPSFHLMSANSLKQNDFVQLLMVFRNTRGTTQEHNHKLFQILGGDTNCEEDFK